MTLGNEFDVKLYVVDEDVDTPLPLEILNS